jgi:hypothetical protein
MANETDPTLKLGVLLEESMFPDFDFYLERLATDYEVALEQTN